MTTNLGQTFPFHSTPSTMVQARFYPYPLFSVACL